MLSDYDIFHYCVTVFYNITNVIKISKNPVQHSRIKRFDIRHHFIRDLVEEKVITLEHVSTKPQLADLFTKALDFDIFSYLRKSINWTIST